MPVALCLALSILATLATASYNWTAVDYAVEKAIINGVFYGCVVGVATDNNTLLKKAYGTIGHKYGMYSAPINVDMMFDLGRLTLPIGINAGLMQLWDRSMILTTNKVGYIYSPFDNNGKRYVTVQNILEHNSGLQATYDKPLPSTPAELIKIINNLGLQYKTENKTVYSQLGAIVMGQVISKLASKTLPDALFEIWTIIGLRDTAYKPILTHEKIAPTGYNGRIAWGTPFNKLAHFLEDTAGNSGLFSTVSDVIKYTQLLLNKGQMPGYFRVYSEEVINKFLAVNKYKYNNTRALGWQTIPASGCPCGKKFSPSPNSFGESDPSTGSFVWTDKIKNVTIVLLANGAFPAGKTMDATPYQAEISDAIMSTLGY